jgi:hypothetical protein
MRRRARPILASSQRQLRHRRAEWALKVSLKHEIRKEGYYEMSWKVRSGKLLTTLAKLVGAAK